MLKFERHYICSFKIPYQPYMDTLHSGIILKGARLGPDRFFNYKKSVTARNREHAVQSVLNWYWEEIKSSWGQAIEVLTVSDPFQEVFYSEDFNCSDRMSNYLDEETIKRVIESSEGVLIIDERVGTKHHPRNNLKRTRRKRVYLERVADSIYQHPNTKTMYYRTTVQPQWSTGGTQGKPGKIIDRRKVDNIKLVSKTLPKALQEIEKRFGND